MTTRLGLVQLLLETNPSHACTQMKPRAGIIFYKKKYEEAINFGVFPQN